MPINVAKLTEDLKEDEGFYLHMYLDNAKSGPYVTIGVGKQLKIAVLNDITMHFRDDTVFIPDPPSGSPSFRLATPDDSPAIILRKDSAATLAHKEAEWRHLKNDLKGGLPAFRYKSETFLEMSKEDVERLLQEEINDTIRIVRKHMVGDYPRIDSEEVPEPAARAILNLAYNQKNDLFTDEWKQFNFALVTLKWDMAAEESQIKLLNDPVENRNHTRNKRNRNLFMQAYNLKVQKNHVNPPKSDVKTKKRPNGAFSQQMKKIRPKEPVPVFKPNIP